MTDEEQLRERAAERWGWRVIVAGLVGGAAGPLLIGSVFRHRHHHGSLLATAIGATFMLVLALVVFRLVMRRRRHWFTGDGWFGAPLTAGLKRRQRRAVARSVRRLQPSQDPLLRTAELDLARRSVRQGRRGAIFFTAMPVLFVVLATTDDDLTAAGHWFFTVATVLTIGLAAWAAYFASRAKRYLALDHDQ